MISDGAESLDAIGLDAASPAMINPKPHGQFVRDRQHAGKPCSSGLVRFSGAYNRTYASGAIHRHRPLSVIEHQSTVCPVRLRTLVLLVPYSQTPSRAKPASLSTLRRRVSASV